MKLKYLPGHRFKLNSCYATDSVEAAIQEYGDPSCFIYGNDHADDMVLLIYPDKFIAAGVTLGNDGEYQHVLTFDK